MIYMNQKVLTPLNQPGGYLRLRTRSTHTQPLPTCRTSWPSYLVVVIVNISDNVPVERFIERQCLYNNKSPISHHHATSLVQSVHTIPSTSFSLFLVKSSHCSFIASAPISPNHCHHRPLPRHHSCHTSCSPPWPLGFTARQQAWAGWHGWIEDGPAAPTCG